MNLEQLKEAARKAKEERLKRETEAANMAKQPPASSLAAVLPSDDDGKEISLGTIASLSPPAAVPPDQGHPLFYYEERTIKERLWWMEWVLGFGPDKQQMEKVRLWWAEYGANAKDRKQPYLDEGIPMLPYTVEPKYRYWDSGQPLLSTLLELGAADKMIDERVTKERNPNDWRRWQEIKAKRRK